MDFDDVRNILKNVEHKVKDRIDIIGILPFMTLFSEQSNQQIRAQEKQQGNGYASNIFFDIIRSRPTCFFTLLAALLKLGQTDIYNIFIEETRRCYRNKEAKLVEVLRSIDEEKQRLGVQNHESDPCEDPHFRDGSNWATGTQTGRQRPSMTRKTQSAEFPSPPPPDPPAPVLQRPYSSPSQFAEHQFEPPTICGRKAGQGEKIKSLKANLCKKLAQELEKKRTVDNDDNNDEDSVDEPYWMAISEHEELDLDISQDDLEKLEQSKQPGRDFLNLLPSCGYTIDDLEEMFNCVGMQNAVALLRQRGATRSGRQNNLNTAGSGSNLSNPFASLNITDPKDRSDKEFVSLPVFTVTGKIQFGTGSELQPLQPSMSSSGSLSSLSSNTSYSNLTDDSLKPVQPIQSVGDPEGTQSAPNPSMDARKLTEDFTAVHPASTAQSGDVISVRGTTPLDHSDSRAAAEGSCSTTFGHTATTQQQGSGGIPTVVPDSLTSYNNSYTSGPVTASNIQAPHYCHDDPNTRDPPTSTGNLPNVMALDGTVSAWGPHTSPRVTPTSAHGGAQTQAPPSPPYGLQGAQMSPTTANSNQSIAFSSYSESSVLSIDGIDEAETELKVTTAVQPTSAREQYAPDYQREAEKLRNDRVHQLDDDPSNLASFQDIQREPDQQEDQGQLANSLQEDGEAPASATDTHEFRSSVAPPDLIGSLNINTEDSQAAADDTTHETTEVKLDNVNPPEDKNKAKPNIPNLDELDSHRSDTSDHTEP